VNLSRRHPTILQRAALGALLGSLLNRISMQRSQQKRFWQRLLLSRDATLTRWL
jgi:hypothetical protein